MPALNTDPAAPEKRAFSVPEVVRTTSIGRTRLYQEISEGRLKAHKLGKRTVVFASDLDTWLATLPAAR